MLHFIRMQTKDLKKVLERIPTWPKDAQQEALQSLKIIEEDFVPDAELAADLARADEQIRRGQGTPQEEVFERLGL
jgi:uncharacterized membrane-anchored protein